MLALTIDGTTTLVEEHEQQDAMRQFWEARQSGDTSARLVRVDPDEARVLARAATQPARAGEVSPVARDRVRRQEAWLAKAGFSLPPPLYAPGTRVIDVGDDNFRLERQRVEALPTWQDASTQVQETVLREARFDLDAPLSSLTMTEEGALVAEGVEYGLELDSFSQLAQLAGFGAGARYLGRHCSPDLRATNVNAHLKNGGDRRVRLRTRFVRGRANVFAVVTPSYAAVDTHVVLEAVDGQLDDARTEMLYDGTGVSATALFMPDQVVDLAAGDVFKVGVLVKTQDTGKGRIQISAVVWRNLCLNLIVIARSEVNAVNQVHRGDAARITDGLAEGVLNARESVGDFLNAWGRARTVSVDPRKTFDSWLRERRLGFDGRMTAERRDQIVHELMVAWEKEPGHTLADAVNAVTRAAHEVPDWDHGLRASLEQRASELVYA